MMDNIFNHKEIPIDEAIAFAKYRAELSPVMKKTIISFEDKTVSYFTPENIYYLGVYMGIKIQEAVEDDTIPFSSEPYEDDYEELPFINDGVPF